MIWKSGRWVIIIFVLLSLTVQRPSNRSSWQEDAQIATLVRLARTDLRARPGIPAEVIALESIQPLAFPCSAPDACQERQPGYIIRLAVENAVYEYNVRMLGKQAILWYEVEIGRPVNVVEKQKEHSASNGAASQLPHRLRWGLSLTSSGNAVG